MKTPKKAKTGRRKKTTSNLTEAEWAIIRVIWDQEPCAAGTVQEALADSKGWSYATVKITMDRMVQKGFLTIQKIRNLQLFSTSISRVDAKRVELHKMLGRAFGGTLSPMLKFLIEHEGLSKEEASELRTLVNQAGKKRS
ncbi:MAG: BlaI/MecI/CopY family transcriptional regulator [Phycisphaeraceae bacterium]|nr:BlaI/MecI/CopY family transcriptional regulator [Phycisphaeraceae bacterium]